MHASGIAQLSRGGLSTEENSFRDEPAVDISGFENNLFAWRIVSNCEGSFMRCCGKNDSRTYGE